MIEAVDVEQFTLHIRIKTGEGDAGANAAAAVHAANVIAVQVVGIIRQQQRCIRNRFHGAEVKGALNSCCRKKRPVPSFWSVGLTGFSMALDRVTSLLFNRS